MDIAPEARGEDPVVITPVIIPAAMEVIPVIIPVVMVVILAITPVVTAEIPDNQMAL